MTTLKSKAPLYLALLLALTVSALAQETIDYPTGTDWTTVTRPAGSIIVGASHTDNDEYAVPLGRYAGSKFAKTVIATGPVDYLAYSGPPATSTFENFGAISAQLTAAGYKVLFTCAKEQCNGSAFAMALAEPLRHAINGIGYHNLLVNTMGAYTGDVRYSAFQRDNEYFCLMTTLVPGKHSGVLLVNVGGKNPIPTENTTAPKSKTPAKPTPVLPRR